MHAAEELQDNPAPHSHLGTLCCCETVGFAGEKEPPQGMRLFAGVPQRFPIEPGVGWMPHSYAGGGENRTENAVSAEVFLQWFSFKIRVMKR